MTDLILAAAISLIVSCLLAWAGVVIARRTPRPVFHLIAFSAAGFLLIFVTYWSQTAALARLLPFSGAIILADLALPATALLAGLAWGRLPSGPWRRAVVVTPLVVLCAFRTSRPLIGAPPAGLGDRWKQGVCVQTSSASCSPAAAATLLRAHGIDATEAEMAALCLTRGDGTPMLGVYRGLALKTRGTPWRVDVVSGATAAESPATLGPTLLSVGLPRNTSGLDPRYEKMWGWVPGMRHTVVSFAFAPDGRVEIGDPAVGREHWSAKDLHVLWGGEGLRLARVGTKMEDRR